MSLDLEIANDTTSLTEILETLVLSLETLDCEANLDLLLEILNRKAHSLGMDTNWDKNKLQNTGAQ